MAQKDSRHIKLKRLRPSMREKERYMVVSFKGRQNLDKREAYNLVDTALLKGLGFLGYAKASIKPIQFDAVKNKAIVSVGRKHLADAKTALLLAGLVCVGVSGTINRARQKFL